MQKTNYDQILQEAKKLDIADQLHLLEDLTSQIRNQNKTKAKRSILELQGLGKEIWSGVDAQTYLNRERDSWNG